MGASRRRAVLPVDFRFEEHRGEWVVLVDDQVVETGTNLCDCLARARTKHPREEPFVLKVLTKPPRDPSHLPRRR